MAFLPRGSWLHKHYQTKGKHEVCRDGKQENGEALGDINHGFLIKGRHESSSQEEWERTAEMAKKENDEGEQGSRGSTSQEAGETEDK